MFKKIFLEIKECCVVTPSNINGDVMVTIRLVFMVAKIQQYSDSFVQDLLRAGLSSVMHGNPLEVPQFGQISTIILLGSKIMLSSFHCLSTTVFTVLH